MGRRSLGYLWVIIALAVAGLWLIWHHWTQLGLDASWRTPVAALSFGWLLITIGLGHLNQRFTDPTAVTAGLRATVIVPLFNEDPVTFRRMLDTLDAQTRRPDRVHVIDDGSITADGTPDGRCQLAFQQWAADTPIGSTEFTYKHNDGKREAQAIGFRADPAADVFVTIDSDTVLDQAAIEQGLMPFAHPNVMSVAGLLVGLNSRTNLLTRLVDLGFVTSFLNGRAAWSRMRSVSVNCGGLAFYRAHIVRTHLDEYLTQTVFGRRAASGDDRVLTNFALLEGWTVFQETSVGYTLLPQRWGHLTRQRIRWWRSFFWGSIWLIRRFSPNRLVWWLVTWQLAAFSIYTVILPTVLLVDPLADHAIPWALFAYIAGLSYVRAARYLLLKRPDETLPQQLATFALAPLCSLLNVYLCSALQYVGLATVGRTSWGTRQQVEVALEVPAA